MHRPHRVLVLPFLLAALAAPALASIAKPPSGTELDLVLGQKVAVKLANANNCSFDYLAMAADAGIVSLTRTSGTDVKGATVSIEAIGVGATTVTIMTMNQTCPPADHSYGVTVSADWTAAEKDFGQLVRASFKDYKGLTKAAFSDYGGALLDLRLQYKAGDLDDDELHDGFHDAAVDLRRAFHDAGAWAFMDVIGGGTEILGAAGAGLGEAPPGFFAGGCGDFDWFQDSVCGVQADFHDRFDKASKKGIKQLGKLGAPMFGQWNTLLPLVAAGPLYPDQAPVQEPLQVLAAPLTITTRPASSSQAADGRLLVSGTAGPALTGPFTVTITRMVVDEPDFDASIPPAIGIDGEWTALFDDLGPGAYTLSTGYGSDEAAVELQFAINVRF